jgi:Flp pilus assembly protein TadG
MPMPSPRNFWKNRRGAVAVTVALAAVTLFVAAGVAIDMARAYRAKHALQYNVDQAAIAAAAVAYSEDPSADPDIDEMEEVAAKFFSANNALSEDLVVVTEPPQFSYSENTDALVVSVPATVETTFLKIVDINEIRFTVSSNVARPEWGPVELALVLDRTWSMSEVLNGVPKYETLQTAATDLVSSLMQNPNASVGVIPFATWLRVTSSYWNQSWLYVPPDYNDPGSKICSYPNRSGCSIQGSTPCEVDGVATMCPGGGQTCTYWGPCGPMVSTQKRSYSFDGCFASRYGYLDTIKDPANPPYMGRQPSEQMYYGACAQSYILDLTKGTDSGGTGLKTVKNRISQLVPVNNITASDTYIPGGLEFGWHMLTPEQPLDKAVSRQQAEIVKLTKAIVLMTDGINNTAPGPNATWFDNTWKRQFDQSGVLYYPSEYADKMTAILCEKIKNDGIVIFTVAFSVNNDATQQMLKTCASKPEYFYPADTSTALLDAFQRIGSSLKYLRIKG